MKQTFRLMCYTAAAVLSAGAAFAAIDGNALAERYLAEGHDFVEVKVGPTRTKVEAIKGTRKVEVIYDNETLRVIGREDDAAADDEIGRTGKRVRKVESDFDRDKDDGRHGARSRSDDEDDYDDDDNDDDDRDDDGDDDGDD